VSKPQVDPPSADTAPTDPADPADGAAIWQTVQQARQWLDAQNGCGRPEQGMRILKISEEIGEVATAWAGVTGQNPRKGSTHSLQDVADELGDVALTALVAVASLGFDPRQVLAGTASKVRERLAAVQAAAEATP